jgi:outer membrane protein
MKRTTLLALAVLSTVSLAAHASGVAVVDMQKVFNTAPQANEIKTDLQKEFTGRRDKLTTMSKQFQQDLNQYTKNKAVMSDKDLEKLKAKLSSEGDALKKGQMQYQQDLYKQQSSKTTAFINKVKAIAASIAQKKGFDLVLPKNTVLYSKTDSDITSQVMSGLK